jgi:5-methylcytosine-specific restriction endonuclease McrA
MKRPVSAAKKRDGIFMRDAYRCVYCGLQFESSELTVDHVEPRMRGGDQSGGNLVTCCASCNREKGGQPAWSFLASRTEQRENFLRYATATWPRLRRAIEEAARSNNPGSRPKL